MRRFIALTLLAATTLTMALGQTDRKKFMTPNAQSPPMDTSVTINGKDIWLVYHAPSVKGRKIFGGGDALQKDETTWRGGADWATFLHTDAALDLNGVALPAGEYTLFIALDKGKWQLIVNKQIGQWGIKRDGTANFDDANTVGRVAMTMSKPPALVEQLKWTLSGTGGAKGTLKLEWENVAASVPFTVK
jgi:hypothetical protein